MMSKVTGIGRWLANYLQYYDNFISELEMQTKSAIRKNSSGKHLHYKLAKGQIQVITNIESVGEIHFIFRRVSKCFPLEFF